MSCVCVTRARAHAKKSSYSGIFDQDITTTTAESRYSVTNPVLPQQAHYYNYLPPAYTDLYSLPQQDTSNPFQDQQQQPQDEDYPPIALYPITESHPATEPTISHPVTETTVSHPAVEPTISYPATAPTVSHPATEPTVSHPATEPVTEPTISHPATVSHLATEPNPGEEAL